MTCRSSSEVASESFLLVMLGFLPVVGWLSWVSVCPAGEGAGVSRAVPGVAVVGRSLDEVCGILAVDRDGDLLGDVDLVPVVAAPLRVEQDLNTEIGEHLAQIGDVVRLQHVLNLVDVEVLSVRWCGASD